ncbi:hypothetical protein PV327_011077 [Microctonus hyperodae]|uniref:Uncharacterized protein n=1 Tax=Microctonus hyperodae TaxID=165561 RepID=A0AA39F091_MICHY|nr:hypothetical protein PV327_011077 [Microctonus hyperodae]
MAFIKYHTYVPCEWMNDINYEHLIDQSYNEMEFYVDVHGHYNGFVSTKNNITAHLVIDNIRKIYWFKRIRIEDDQRPHTVNYFPRLAPLHLESQWQFIPFNSSNNNNNDDDANNGSTDDDDEVSTNDDDNNYNQRLMDDLFLQNWIAADENDIN